MADLPDRPVLDERADSPDHDGATRTLPDWGPPLPREYACLDSPAFQTEADDPGYRPGRKRDIHVVDVRDRRLAGVLSKVAKGARQQVSNGSDLARVVMDHVSSGMPDVHIDLTRLAPKPADDTATELPAPPLASAWDPAGRESWRSFRKAVQTQIRRAPFPRRPSGRPAAPPPPAAGPDHLPVDSEADPTVVDFWPGTGPTSPTDEESASPTVSYSVSYASDPEVAADPAASATIADSDAPLTAAGRSAETTTGSWGSPISPLDDAVHDEGDPTLAATAFRPWMDGEPTTSFERTGLLEAFAPTAGTGRAGRRESRPTRTVRRISVRSVVRLSLVFYTAALVVLVVAGLILWFAADAFGALSSIDKSIRSLFALKSFTLHPGLVVAYSAAAGLVLAIAGTLANVLIAVMYNLVADVVGGIRVEVEEPGE